MGFSPGSVSGLQLKELTSTPHSIFFQWQSCRGRFLVWISTKQRTKCHCKVLLRRFEPAEYSTTEPMRSSARVLPFRIICNSWLNGYQRMHFGVTKIFFFLVYKWWPGLIPLSLPNNCWHFEKNWIDNYGCSYGLSMIPGARAEGTYKR